MTAPESTPASRDLDDLRYHCGEAYRIDYCPGAPARRWRAERLDDHAVFTAASPSALRERIIDDYTLRPVPRAIDPSQQRAAVSRYETRQVARPRRRILR